jgi:phytoene dehydrogenase-like protein
MGWRAKLEVGMFLASVAKMDPRPLEGLTLAEWLSRSLRSLEARQLVEVSIRTGSYANATEQLSAAAGLRQLRIGLSGAMYMHGGWQTMVDALRAQAKHFGATIVSGARVDGIQLDGTAARAVRLADGRLFEVGATILAVPPQKASALVDGGRQPALAGWAARAVPVHAASLDVALSRLPRPNDWFALALDRPLYLSVHSKWANLAPEGGALIHVLRYLEPGARGAADDERELEGLLDLVQPGWQDSVVTRHFMPNLMVAGALPSVAWEQSEGPRGAAVPGVDGLYVAGDWVGPDGMLADRALGSGVRAGHEAARLAARQSSFSAPASRSFAPVPVAVEEVA